MDLLTAMQQRHSVRAYQERPLEPEVRKTLQEAIAAVNRESGLHIQLVTDEPTAFDCMMAHYGKFSGVTNYLALVGPKGPDLDERCGYYGEKLVLRAQQLGLNTCWVAMSYKKVPSAFQLAPGEKLALVIALGYGKTSGVAHKSKAPEAVSTGAGPDWFASGVRAALLAPTAMNQQKFHFTLEGDRVAAKAGMGFYTKLDLGIAKYHFALGAGTDNFTWA